MAKVTLRTFLKADKYKEPVSYTHLERVLDEFPVTEIGFRLPAWLVYLILTIGLNRML